MSGPARTGPFVFSSPLAGGGQGGGLAGVKRPYTWAGPIWGVAKW